MMNMSLTITDSKQVHQGLGGSVAGDEATVGGAGGSGRQGYWLLEDGLTRQRKTRKFIGIESLQVFFRNIVFSTTTGKTLFNTFPLAVTISNTTELLFYICIYYIYSSLDKNKL